MVKLPDSTIIPDQRLREQRPQSRIDGSPIARGAEEIGRAVSADPTGRAIQSGGSAIGQAETAGGTAVGQSITRGGEVMAAAQAAGGAAFGKGLETFGAGISKAGQGLADFKLANDHLDYARAQSEFQTKKIQLDSEFANDQEYGTLQERYTKKLTDIRETTSTMVNNPGLREHFDLDTAPKLEAGTAKASQLAFNGLKSQKTGDALQRLDDLKDSALQTSDPAERANIVKTANALITSLAGAGFIDPVKAQELRIKWAESYSKSTIAILPDEEQINMLREAPTGRDATLDRIGGVENATGNPNAKNPNSTATGNFQFIEKTWLDTLRAHRPDIAQGRDDRQLLALRGDGKLSREMAGYLLDDNSKVLRGAGVVPTPTTLYLAHFLGAQGAVDVLKAKPGTPVDEILSEGAITSNRSVLADKTTDSVIAWANKKMGGATRGRGDAIDFIDETDRVNLLNSATSRVLNKQRQSDSETAIAQDQVKTRIQDDVHKMLTFGQGDDNLTPDIVRSVGGSAGVIKWQAAREDAHKIWVNSHDLYSLPETQITQRLAQIAPQKTDPDFARKEVIQEAVQKQAAAVLKKRQEDPAASVSEDPVVQNAAKALSDAPESVQALATARMIAQKSAGIASPVPATMQEMQGIASRLSAPVPVGTDPGKAMAEESAKWGGYWPTIYGKLYSNGADTSVKSYGPGFIDAYRRIHLPDGDPNRLTDPTSLYSRVGANGDLTVSGVDKLASEIKGRGTPEGVAETEMKSQFFKTAKAQISGSDEGLHIHDPKGDQLYLKFMAQVLPAYDAGRKAGKSAVQLLNPDSPDYVGKTIDQFKRPMDQWFGDVVQGGGPVKAAEQPFDVSKVKSLNDLVVAYRAGKVPKATADQLAVDKGWAIRPATPMAVPVSQ